MLIGVLTEHTVGSGVSSIHGNSFDLETAGQPGMRRVRYGKFDSPIPNRGTRLGRHELPAIRRLLIFSSEAVGLTAHTTSNE
jgi:hypothetical protein